MLEFSIAIFVLLVMSAFFSGAETAMTASSRALLRQLEIKGNRRARLVNRLRENPGNMIGSILIGNNLVNITASALATSALIGIFGPTGIAYATVGMTAIVVIFAEILPKTYAYHHATRISLFIAPILIPFIKLLTPLSFGAQAIVRAALYVMGTGLHLDRNFVSSYDVLRGAIALHHESEDSRAHESAMLRSVLDLAEVEVGEVMVHRRDLVTVDISLEPSAFIDQVLKSRYTRLPVWDGESDNIVGILHAKALMRAVHNESDAMDKASIVAMLAEPWFVPETTKLLDQLQAFRERAEHFALVVDEYGSLMGVVTLEDILEEIVGDISDELDRRTIGVRRQPDGSVLVNGTVTIRDLNREFEWQLPDEEAATIAGLVLHEARRIPEVGQVFKFHGFRFEIVRRQRHQITTLRITPPKPLPDETRGKSG
jgi:Mg2+/Co2+ transporter CorB